MVKLSRSAGYKINVCNIPRCYNVNWGVKIYLYINIGQGIEITEKTQTVHA